jgi:hypothetical protein
VLLYDDVTTALSANFEALKAQEESVRYPVAKTKSAASIPVLGAGSNAVGCLMLHNKLDCGAQYVEKLPPRRSSLTLWQVHREIV